MSNVAFEVTFPIVHPVSAKHTWHRATVMCDALDFTNEQVFEIVRDTITLDRHGSVGAILQLAETLRNMTDEISVLIVWEPMGLCSLPFEPDEQIEINYDSGKICIDCNEFTFRSIEHFRDDGIDWRGEFLSLLAEGSR